MTTTRQKTGENRPHAYLHISQPDKLAVIDFAATHDAAEVTVEVTRDGEELHVLVKCGPDVKILENTCYDVAHDVDRIDFSEESGEDFSGWLRDNEPGAEQDDYRHHFEHGQWWVMSTVSGETWSAVETLGEDGTPGVGFELITEGEE
tara:strand:+ start:255 stop:698 length:444 start_codon:yes stop_codon:yes gene_type:complete